MKNRNNIQFCLLSLLGIIFVVDGHLNDGLFDLNGLFYYYSFHMPLFVFISGYFYQPGSEQDIPGYIKHKFLRLMVPYFIWNLIYGIGAQVLRQYGFAFGEPVTPVTLFIEPFCHGYQFILNHAAWFVPTLFLLQAANVCIIRVMQEAAGLIQKNGGKSERLTCIQNTCLHPLVCGIIGLAGIFLSKTVGTEGFWLTLVKVMFLLPFYGVGMFYREKLETRDRLGNGWYFSVLLGISLALALSGWRVVYAVSDCRDLTGYLLPYLTGFLGIAFWLRVCRILAPAFEHSRLVQYAGRNTFAIMMHHMMVFLIIKTGYAFLAKQYGMFADFSFESYKTDFYYCYLPYGLLQFRMLYLILAIALPLSLQAGIDRCRRRWGRRKAPGNDCKNIVN